MSFVYDNEVKRLLGEERYSALINAVEVKAIIPSFIPAIGVSLGGSDQQGDHGGAGQCAWTQDPWRSYHEDGSWGKC